MTGFKSKKTAALDEEGMYLVHQTASYADNFGKSIVALGKQTVKDMEQLNKEMSAVVHPLVFSDFVPPQPAQKPQRPWVDLTDEEIQDCDPHEDCWHLFKIARAVLAKSKEKNNG